MKNKIASPVKLHVPPLIMDSDDYHAERMLKLRQTLRTVRRDLQTFRKTFAQKGGAL